MTLLDDVLADLAAEGDALEAMVAGLDEDGWRTPTPAAGWDVATQVVHLAWTDEVAVAAATDKQAWDAIVLEAIGDPEGYVDTAALAGAQASPAEILDRWRTARPALQQALRAYPTGERMPWFGPPMSPTSMATARFMETWAHSLDVAEALGHDPLPTDRIRHVTHLGVRTRTHLSRREEEDRHEGEDPEHSRWVSRGPRQSKGPTALRGGTRTCQARSAEAYRGSDL